MKRVTKVIVYMLVAILVVMSIKPMSYAEESMVVNIERSGEDNSTEESTSEDDSTEESTSEDDSTEEGTSEDDSTEEGTSEDDSTEEGTREDDSTEESSSEESSSDEPNSEEPTTEPPTIDVEEKETVRVLFVGNSFTRSGGTDIGEMLEKIADSQGEILEADVIVNPGFYLTYYTNQDIGHFAYHHELINALRDNQYDYVVLQESSFGSIENIVGMSEAVNKIKNYVQYYQADAKVLLYLTHPYADGTTVEINGEDVSLSKKDRLKYTQVGYTYVGKEMDIKVVPAGVAFFRSYTAFPNISWYKSDNKHPAHSAFYAMACSFYREIYGTQPVLNETFIEDIELTAEEQQNIAGIAYNSLEFDVKYKVLGEGEKLTINAKFIDNKVENVSFSSIDKRVASVKNGVITAHSEGATAIIGRTASGSQAVCIIIVEDAEVRAKGISFVNSKHILEIGEKHKSIPRVSKAYNNHKLKWSVSGKTVAKVSSDGVVTALAPGRAKITVKNVVNGKSASYYVYVRNKAPLNLRASNVVSGKGAKASVYIKLNWDKSSDTTHYVVYRSTKANSGYKMIATTNKAQYVDKSVERNKAYYYKITTYKNHTICESDKSSYVKAISLSAPKTTVASQSKNKIKITWNKNNYATGYIIYRANGKGKPYKKVATITSKMKVTYTDKKVKANRNYYYSVQAYRKIGEKTFYSNRLSGIRIKAVNKKSKNK